MRKPNKANYFHFQPTLSSKNGSSSRNSRRPVKNWLRHLMTATTSLRNIVRIANSVSASPAGASLRSVLGIGALLVGMMISSSSFAQMTGGTISGTVTDSSQAAIPGAAVSILNKETGDTRTVSANDKGFYSAPSLQP